MAREVVRVEGLAGVLDALKQLPPEVVSRNGGPVKAALKRAAELIQGEAKHNVRRIVSEPNIDGLPTESSGLLEQNIVVSRSKPPSGMKGERMVVRIRKKAYPVKGGKPVVTPQVGRLLEYGTEKMSPKPWLRPAFESKKQAALDMFVGELKERAQKVIDKLARQARKAARRK